MIPGMPKPRSARKTTDFSTAVPRRAIFHREVRTRLPDTLPTLFYRRPFPKDDAL
jgi:hypothetical protein